MKYNISAIFILIIVLFSCKSIDQQKNYGLISINLVDAYFNRKAIKLSSIANEISYIQLGTSRNAILGGGPRIFATDSFIVSSGYRKIDLFDRATGKYIRQLGKYGRGPNEFNRTRHVEAFDEVANNIYAQRSDELIAYNTKGELTIRLKTPQEFSNTTKLKDNIYAAFIPNRRKLENRKIVLFDGNKEETIKTFPNFQVSIPVRYTGYSAYEGWFYHFENNLFFKEFFNDTLFQVTQSDLIPKYEIDCGKYKSPYRNFESDKITEYFMTRLFIENTNYLFFELSFDKKTYCVKYDKKNNKCYVSDIGLKSVNGFKNDLDNFVDFVPQSINKNNELIGFIEAFELVKWLKENPEKAAKLPPHLQKFKNISENDNPIVMIVKLKK